MAFHILIPCAKRVGQKEDGDPIFACYGFKGAAVFRIEDTEGEALPVDEQYENWIESLPLRDVAESWSLSIKGYNGKPGKAHGKYYGRGHGVEAEGIAIVLGVENLSTWLHKLMHAANHTLGKLVERGQHWRSETVAKFGSAVLAACLGFEREADLGGAYEYVKAYAETAGYRSALARVDGESTGPYDVDPHDDERRRGRIRGQSNRRCATVFALYSSIA